MPPIPPAQLAPGQSYTYIRRANPGHLNRRGSSRRFVQLNQTGAPRFNEGHGLTSRVDPAIFDFYDVNDPMSGIQAPPAASAAPAAGMGGKRRNKSRKMKRRLIKKKKTLKRK